MANSPLSQETDLVSYSIMINGQELSSGAVVHTVEVKKEVNKIPTATIVVLDGDPASLSFPLSEGDTFKPGNKVKISAGYHQKEESIFEGLIVSVGSNSFSLLGRTITTNQETEFRDAKSKVISAEAFYALALGQRVEVKGIKSGELFLALRIEIKES